MNTLQTRLLRRTLAFLAGMTALGAAVPAAAQGVATLSTGASCNYSSMTVLPNGSIQIACATTQSPNYANFSLSGPTAMAPNGREFVTVTRSGGPAESVGVRLSVTGAGCNNGFADLTFGATDPAQQIPIITFAGGSCSVSLTPQTGGHTASPALLNIVVGSGGGGDPVVVPGCPAPPLDAVARSLDYGPVDQLRMKSGIIASYPVIPSPDARFIAVDFTQGQQPNTPGSVTTEFSVSKCPGVIDTSVAGCYYKSTLAAVNSNKITIFTQPKPEWGWNDQNSVSAWGCLADSSQGQWYVNVRWTYPSCPWGDNNCGFSMQWAIGSW